MREGVSDEGAPYERIRYTDVFLGGGFRGLVNLNFQVWFSLAMSEGGWRIIISLQPMTIGYEPSKCLQ